MTAVLSRRSILKALGIAPAAAHMVGQQLAGMACGGAGFLEKGVGALGGIGSPPQPAQMRSFFSFSDWWREIGKDRAETRADEMTGFDPDIVSLHLPLLTKVRMQRRRNINRLRERTERDFLRRLFAAGGEYKEWA